MPQVRKHEKDDASSSCSFDFDIEKAVELFALNHSLSTEEMVALFIQKELFTFQLPEELSEADLQLLKEEVDSFRTILNYLLAQRYVSEQS